VVSKAEVCSLMHLADVHSADQNPSSEVAGGAAAKLCCKRKNQAGVDAGIRQQFQLALQWRDQRLRLFGAKHTRWMRVEGDGQGVAAQKSRARDHLRNHSLMAKMHTVEVADGGDNRGIRGRQFVELAIDDQGSC